MIPVWEGHRCGNKLNKIQAKMSVPCIKASDQLHLCICGHGVREESILTNEMLLVVMYFLENMELLYLAQELMELSH